MSEQQNPFFELYSTGGLESLAKHRAFADLSVDDRQDLLNSEATHLAMMFEHGSLKNPPNDVDSARAYLFVCAQRTMWKQQRKARQLRSLRVSGQVTKSPCQEVQEKEEREEVRRTARALTDRDPQSTHLLVETDARQGEKNSTLQKYCDRHDRSNRGQAYQDREAKRKEFRSEFRLAE